ncbi:MAG: Xaa-Pro peptidase family protein [Nitrospiraceae bacterium]|nr:Xaa-Pro peptidase family protein [Nitrospiraceae bacterium]
MKINKELSLNDYLQNRLTSLRRSLKGADAILISNISNVRYLTGFTGSAGHVLITRKEAVFITDSRYGKDALGPAGALYETIVMTGNFWALLKRASKKLGIKKLGFEKTASYAFYEKLKGIFVSGEGLLVPFGGAVERLRVSKDDYEIMCIKGAVARAEEAFEKIKTHIRAGVTEKALATRLEEALLRGGSSKLPFPAIVASGANSAIPHARPSQRRMSQGDLVVMDWGGEYEGYFSDMTRTFLLKGAGERIAEKRKIYRTVLEAQRNAIDFVTRNGGAAKKPKDIDNSARYVIKQAGYGELFGHGTGHGVGLEIHEQPGLSPRSTDNKPLPKGAVITIEPGIYVPGLGGVRIEDMVCLAPGNPEVLTRLPKEKI